VMIVLEVRLRLVTALIALTARERERENAARERRWSVCTERPE